MANKLTKEKIDLLIEQVLFEQEKYVPTTGGATELDGGLKIANSFFFVLENSLQALEEDALKRGIGTTPFKAIAALEDSRKKEYFLEFVTDDEELKKEYDEKLEEYLGSFLEKYILIREKQKKVSDLQTENNSKQNAETKIQEFIESMTDKPSIDKIKVSTEAQENLNTSIANKEKELKNKKETLKQKSKNIKNMSLYNTFFTSNKESLATKIQKPTKATNLLDVITAAKELEITINKTLSKNFETYDELAKEIENITQDIPKLKQDKKLLNLLLSKKSIEKKITEIEDKIKETEGKIKKININKEILNKKFSINDEIKQKFKSAEMKPGFNLQKIAQQNKKEFDPQIKLTRDFEKVMTDFGVKDIADTINSLQTIINKNLQDNLPTDSDEDFNINKLIGLNEDISYEKILDVDDLEEFFKIDQKNINDNHEKIEKALRQSYREIYDQGEKSPEKKAQLKILKILLDSLEYYASGQTRRTTSGPMTGYSLGTAQTSGTARMQKEVVDVFNNISETAGNSIEGLKTRFLEFSEFLTKIKKGDFGFDKNNISREFSRFVALEVLHEMLFKTEEQSVVGFEFEAFLAAFSGGAQVGGERGAADFMIGSTEASAKVYNKLEFEQAKSGLKKGVSTGSPNEIVYLIGIKSIKTDQGLKRTARETERIRYLDIYMTKVHIEKIDKDYTYSAYPAFQEKNDENTVLSKGTGKAAVFDMRQKNLARNSFITTLDFSFLAHQEFEERSSEIMSNINKQVEKAYAAMTSLKDNVTRWVTNKDLVAANETIENENNLRSALEGMREDDQLKSDKLSETKSLKELDKLIERVILNKMNKL